MNIYYKFFLNQQMNTFYLLYNTMFYSRIPDDGPKIRIRNMDWFCWFKKCVIE
jgi:hypothetical protein